LRQKKKTNLLLAPFLLLLLVLLILPLHSIDVPSVHAVTAGALCGSTCFLLLFSRTDMSATSPDSGLTPSIQVHTQAGTDNPHPELLLWTLSLQTSELHLLRLAVLTILPDPRSSSSWSLVRSPPHVRICTVSMSIRILLSSVSSDL